MTLPLPLFHRVAGQPVIVLGAGEGAQAKRRLVERAGGCVVADIAAGLAQGARLAFIAHDSHADAGADAEPGIDQSAADAATLRAAGLLVNVVDRPELCDFTTPAIIDRAPVLVAIGTGGASAGLAKAVRLRLEALLPPGMGAVAQALFAARGALRARFPDAGDRRRALDAALGEGGALDPFDPETDGAARVAAWLEYPDSAGDAGPADACIVIRLTSDDPEDLTLRQARLLGGADKIAHEPEVSSQVLARARADAARIAIDRDQPPPVVKGRLIVLRAPATRG